MNDWRFDVLVTSEVITGGGAACEYVHSWGLYLLRFIYIMY